MRVNKAHIYRNITRQHIDSMLDELLKNGSAITGENPWSIDTKQSGVKLKGEWSQEASTLSVIISGKEWYVPSSQIWETIDKLVAEIKLNSTQTESVLLCTHFGQTGK